MAGNYLTETALSRLCTERGLTPVEISREVIRGRTVWGVGPGPLPNTCVPAKSRCGPAAPAMAGRCRLATWTPWDAAHRRRISKWRPAPAGWLIPARPMPPWAMPLSIWLRPSGIPGRPYWTRFGAVRACRTAVRSSSISRA